VITMSWRIQGGDYDSAGLATSRLKEHLARAGVGAAAMRRAMIASYEAEMNVVIHARTGTLWARLDSGRLDLEVADEGPGIPDVDAALREGWSTASERARQMGFGAGMGLPNIRRSSDLFEIETRVGRGTRVRSTIMLDASQPGVPVQADTDAVVALSIDAARCRLCTGCVRACPTGALRVRNGGPHLIPELCIGCAVCAGECPGGVYGIRDLSDVRAPGLALNAIGDGRPDPVLVVARGFLAGFPLESAPSRVLGALARLGFRHVRLLEEWTGALLDAARAAVSDGGCGSLPIIPPVCPAVAALVESRFPSLIPNLGPWLSPAEAAGEEFPLAPVVLAAACPAQYAAARRASHTGRLSVVSAARLAAALGPLPGAGGGPREPRLLEGRYEPGAPGAPGVRESSRLPSAHVLTANGADHVLKALTAAEAGGLPGVRILDLSLCEAGCSGSPYLTADACLSGLRWREFAAASCTAPEAAAPARAGPAGTAAAPTAPGTGTAATAVRRTRPWAQRLGVRLDPDMGRALAALGRIDALTRTLPGRDCAACGSPSCTAYAEDVILGRASGASCPHAEETI
jgi:anti-sigma regulatory factor (Ser/Thr protein kinase)/NAD-dependent dihydropyrimidine dehydrogenase PreA subunit